MIGVGVDLRLDAAIPAVRCDGSQMQQVLVNLIMNGAEATHGREDGRLTIITRRGKGAEEIQFVVEDNGEGIPAEIREKIFQPFFTTKGEGKGVGLGLAVVYGIVDAHRGEIDFESTPGKGTTFTVTLPSGETAIQEAGAAVAAGV